MAKIFDGQPTLEHSGSEHQFAVTFFPPEEEDWLGYGDSSWKGKRRSSEIQV